jgi:ribosomal protein S18 acetylase RimI-like enzyme
MKILIRKAKKSDSLKIAKVLAEYYRSLNSSSDASVKAFNDERRRGYHYIVAELDREIVGLAAYFFHGLPKHGLIEIDRFAIKSNLRRKGIGRLIFNFLIKDADNFFKKYGGLRKIFLSTRAENKPAQKFYEAIGFVYEGKLKKHFYNDKDDYIYSYFIMK